MGDILSKFDSGDFIGLVAVIGGFLVAAIYLIVDQWRRVRLTEMEAALKQQMLDKGMSAVDIEQVLRASRKSGKKGAAGKETSDKSSLANNLIENGYEGQDIERVLKALPDQPNRPGPEAPRDSALEGKIALVEKMVENGYEVDDIIRILNAFPDQPQRPVEEKEPVTNRA